MWRTWLSCSLTHFVTRFVMKNNKILNHSNQMLNDINQKATLSSTLCRTLPWRHLRSHQILPSVAQPGQHRARQQKWTLQWLGSLLESFLLLVLPQSAWLQPRAGQPEASTTWDRVLSQCECLTFCIIWSAKGTRCSAQAAAFKEPPQNNLCSPWFYWVGHNIQLCSAQRVLFTTSIHALSRRIKSLLWSAEARVFTSFTC